VDVAVAGGADHKGLACPVRHRLGPLGLQRPGCAGVCELADAHFRLLKQTLGWTRPKIRTPQAANRWTWMILAVYTQLRLARPLAADLRRPWEKPAGAQRLSPTRVRRWFRHLRADTPSPAMAPEPSQPGPGPPPGRRNHRPTPRHDVHTAAAATSTKTATKRSKAKRSTNPRPRRTG
jgi:hypothetical protein